MRTLFRRIYIVTIFSPLLTLAQEEGIKFETELNWRQIQEKAKSTNKLIFVDCYATWCIPCKYMDEKIYPEKTVGDFMNSQFISVKVQMDSSNKDPQQVRKWYEDARLIGQRNKVTAFPTLLFFSAEGKLVNRGIGSTNKPADFIGIAKDAVRYMELVQKYQTGRSDTSLLKSIALQAAKINDTILCAEASRAYIRCINNIFSREGVDFLIRTAKTSQDTSFLILFNNIDKVDQVANFKGFSVLKISFIIAREDILPAVEKGESWSRIEKRIVKKYPSVGREVVYYQHMTYDFNKKDWKALEKSATTLLRECPGIIIADASTLNSLAYNLFMHSSDTKVLTAASDWAKLSMKKGEQSWNVDTYASLLYKLGRKEEAIKWEQKAISLDPQNPKFTDRLEKMRRGENWASLIIQ